MTSPESLLLLLLLLFLLLLLLHLLLPRYGADMAAVTDAALSTAGNSYLTFYNAAALGPKGIAKRAAKDTGKALVGVDQAAVNARARLVPDQRNLAIGEVVREVEAANPGPKG